MEILTVRQLSTVLRVSENYIYQLSRKGVIPTMRVGRSLRFNREAVLASLYQPYLGERNGNQDDQTEGR